MARQTAIRDYIDGEKVVQAFFAAYLGLTDHFVLHSERELSKGYADLHLEPFLPRHPDMGYGYLIEFKYLKRGEKLDDGTGGRGGTPRAGSTAGIPGGRAPAARSARAVHRYGAGVSRLGAGVVRSGVTAVTCVDPR